VSARPARSGAVRLGGFVLLPALTALAPLLVLPAITAAFGQGVWVSVAVAQSLGSAAAVLVELGWGLTATQRVARQGAESRRLLLALVTLTKLLVAAPVAVVVAVVVVLVAPGHHLEATLIALGGALGSLNATWLFIGAGRPSLILTVEALPRIGAVFVAAAAIALGGSLWWFVAACLLPSLVCPLVGLAVVGVRPRHLRAFSPRRVVGAALGQRSALTGRALSAAYIALPVVLVGSVASTQVTAVFAAAERLQRMVLSGLQAVPNALQAWVGQPSSVEHRLDRARAAIVVNGLVGVAAGAVLTVAGPALSRLVFSDVATIGHGTAAVSAVLLVVVSLSRVVGGIALVVVGEVRGVAWSALVGAVLGVPLVLLLAASGGVVGALVGEVVAEIAVLAVQLTVLHRAVGRRRVRALARTAPSTEPGTTEPGSTGPRVLYWRIQDVDYPRSVRVREHLEATGHRVDAHERARGRGRVVHDLRALVARSRDADLVVVADQSLDFVAAAWVVARLRRVPLVVDAFIGKYETLVGDQGFHAPWSAHALAYRAVDALAVRLSDVALVDTQVRAAALRSRHRRSTVLSLPVGAPGWVVPRPLRPGPRLRVLFYGSFLPLHGVPTIVHGLAACPRGDVELTIVGTAVHRGGAGDAAELARELGVADRVAFVPTTPPHALNELIGEHDVVLGLFGASEKAGSVIANKVWQGLAAERLVVTRESPALAEISGLVGDQLVTVPAGDAEALAGVLADLAARRPGAFTGAGEVLARRVRHEFTALDDALAVAGPRAAGVRP
jgi:glycosyltransferase involved in cell wall biosynthesis